MTIEEIRELGFEELEKRSLEIAEETATADSEMLETLNAELDAIEERRNALNIEIEERKAAAEMVAEGKGKEIESRKEEIMTNMEIRNSKEYIEAFAFYHAALHHAILANQKNQLNRVNQLQSIVQLITTRPVVNFSSLAQQINADMEGIRKTTSYRNCLSEIYEQTMQAFWQKMKMLGLVVENK